MSNNTPTLTLSKKILYFVHEKRQPRQHFNVILTRPYCKGFIKHLKSDIMELFTNPLSSIIAIFSNMSIGMMIVLPLLIIIGLVAKWRLFDKCGLSKKEILIGTFLPVYDFYLTLKIVGRPGSHFGLIFIPLFNIFFVVKVLFELLNSFGKFHIVDYTLAILFSILYFLNLGLAYNEVYYGTVYDKSDEELAVMKAKAERALA
ncbi:MAG: hypothetical protein ACI8QW_001411 [Saprospiraceae bacterium]|jgi:hypothetical protein